MQVLYICSIGAVAVLSITFGWLACSHIKVGAYRERLQAETNRVRHALAGLSRLAETVSADLRSHHRSLNEAGRELDVLDVREAQVVASVVTGLAEANRQMERRLASAESKLREQQRELEIRSAEASTDELTCLANRRSFNDELARRYCECQRTHRPLSVIFVDVDHFKDLNDREGHQAGDEVLRDLSKTLQHTMRGMDLVARYGGEEFSVVLPNTPLVAAVAVAERAREAIANQETHYDEKVCPITVSAGVAELRPSEDLTSLLRRADEAMYASKAAGRDCTHYHDGQKCVIAPRPDSVEEDDRPSSEAPSPARPDPEAEAVNTIPGRDAPEEVAPKPFEAVGELARKRVCSRSVFCHTLRCRLAEWQRGGAPFTIALLSVDQEAELAKRCGLDERSLLFDQVAVRLADQLSDLDIVTAYDETRFALFLPGTRCSDAICVAERLLASSSHYPFDLLGETLSLSLSIGIAEVVREDDMMRIVDRADEALIAARETGERCGYSHNGHWPEPVVEPATTCGPVS